MIHHAPSRSSARYPSHNERSLTDCAKSALIALTTTHANVLTVGLLAAITAIAITVLDIGLVVGISGSVRTPMIAPDCT